MERERAIVLLPKKDLRRVVTSQLLNLSKSLIQIQRSLIVTDLILHYYYFFFPILF